jgi:hypothetical protein
LLGELASKGVGFAASHEADYRSGLRPKLNPSEFSSLVIQKLPGSRLILNSVLEKVWTSPNSYKAAYYEEPEANQPTIVEVVMNS